MDNEKKLKVLDLLANTPGNADAEFYEGVPSPLNLDVTGSMPAPQKSPTPNQDLMDQMKMKAFDDILKKAATGEIWKIHQNDQIPEQEDALWKRMTRSLK